MDDLRTPGQETACYRLLETEKEGWPNFGRLCDALDVAPDAFAPPPSAAQHRMLSDGTQRVKTSIDHHRAASLRGQVAAAAGNDGQCQQVQLKDTSQNSVL